MLLNGSKQIADVDSYRQLGWTPIMRRDQGVVHNFAMGFHPVLLAGFLAATAVRERFAYGLFSVPLELLYIINLPQCHSPWRGSPEKKITTVLGGVIATKDDIVGSSKARTRDGPHKNPSSR